MSTAEKEYHCNICREIEEGCEAERAEAERSERFPVCGICRNKGFIDLGDGTGIACSACARGYRMKLWLKHEGREFGAIKIAA